jgi:hypothetical protein
MQQESRLNNVYSEFLVVVLQEHYALTSTDRTVLLPDKEFMQKQL